MNLEEIKNILPSLNDVVFEFENGTTVPSHFHVTEIGEITKKFIDCGGTLRNEKVINFQLWNANDVDHRLKPMKLLNLIKLSEKKLSIENGEIEVEFQGKTIEKYDLAFSGNKFLLKSKFTDCLAKDNCGIPTEKLITNTTCSPGGGCC
jgi:hypothetical protein